jgi:hypothetical protein
VTVPIPTNTSEPVSSLNPQLGGDWSAPVYSCATSVRAAVRKVMFSYNDTSASSSILDSLKILSADYSDKNYTWGIEHTNLNLSQITPVWGIISGDHQSDTWTTQEASALYLPGYQDARFFDTPAIDYNFPALDFYRIALRKTYDVGRGVGGESFGDADYTGDGNLVLCNQWTKLSKTKEGPNKIINLMWTDIAANLVIGTHGITSTAYPANPLGFF